MFLLFLEFLLVVSSILVYVELQLRLVLVPLGGMRRHISLVFGVSEFD